MSAYDVVVLAYTPTLSHLTRPLALAGRLRRWGRRVVFAGQGSNKRLIEAEGFEVAPIFEPDAGPLYNNIRRGKLRFVEASTLKRMVSADLELFRSLNPSVVLTDGRFSAPISAQLAGIKHAAIVNASSTAYRADPYVPMLTNFSFLKRSYGQPFVDLMKRINLKLEMSVFDNTMRIFKNLSKFYGLEKEVTATNCLTGADLTLLADLPEYFPTKDLPEDYHYIGPLTWTTGQAVSRPSWWPPAAENRHLLYFTMGTTGVPEFFKVVDEIFSKGRFSAVVTTGGQQAEIKSRPPSVVRCRLHRRGSHDANVRFGCVPRGQWNGLPGIEARKGRNRNPHSSGPGFQYASGGSFGTWKIDGVERSGRQAG